MTHPEPWPYIRMLAPGNSQGACHNHVRSLISLMARSIRICFVRRRSWRWQSHVSSSIPHPPLRMSYWRVAGLKYASSWISCISWLGSSCRFFSLLSCVFCHRFSFASSPPSPACSYIQYSQVCAQLVRNVLKEQHKALAARRETQSLKLFKWEGGKQGPVCTSLALVFFFSFSVAWLTILHTSLF